MASGGMAVGAGVAARRSARSAPLPLRATFGDVEFAGHRTAGWCPIVGLSLVAAVIAYVAGIGAARILGARLSSFVGLTEVMFAVLIAWLVLGELPTAVQLLGGALIVAGVALVRIDELRSPPTRRVPNARRQNRLWLGRRNKTEVRGCWAQGLWPVGTHPRRHMTSLRPRRIPAAHVRDSVLDRRGVPGLHEHPGWSGGWR